MNDYILERISETIFSSGKLSVTIYSLLNDKGSNDGRAYPSATLNLYNSSKYSNGNILGELSFNRTSLIMGFSYNDRTSQPAVRESVNFGEEMMTSQDMMNLVNFEKYIVENFNSIYISGVNNTYTINQGSAPYFELSNNRSLKVTFTPTIVNRIMNNMTVPNPGIRVGINSYSEDITFTSFQYLANQISLYNRPERLAALKDNFKLAGLILGKYRVSEPRNNYGNNNGGGYQNFGQTRNVGNQQFTGGFTGNQQGNNFQQANTNQFNNNGYQQPNNAQFSNNGYQQPSAQSPFQAGGEEVGSNPFAREESPAVEEPATPFKRFTRVDNTGTTTPDTKFTIDKTATVKTDLDSLNSEMNGTPAPTVEEPTATEEAKDTGSKLNNSILGEMDKMIQDDNLDLSDLYEEIN